MQVNIDLNRKILTIFFTFVIFTFYVTSIHSQHTSDCTGIAQNIETNTQLVKTEGIAVLDDISGTDDSDADDGDDGDE